ncbi:Uncharacterised protein [Edwardsiella tarda]|nr:Uncharacterised protein [Edwardsiella tarda]
MSIFINIGYDVTCEHPLGTMLMWRNIERVAELGADVKYSYGLCRVSTRNAGAFLVSYPESSFKTKILLLKRLVWRLHDFSSG